MRKQDRVANLQQDRAQRPDEKQPSREPREREQVKGSESPSPSPRPQRQPGKLPLPD